MALATAGEYGKVLRTGQAPQQLEVLKELIDMGDGGAAYATDVVALLQGQSDKELKVSATQYFAKHSDKALAHSEPLCKLLEDPEFEVRWGAVGIFCAMKDKALPMADRAAKLLGSGDPRFRAAAAAAIGAVGPAAAAAHGAALTKVLQDASEDRTRVPFCVAGLEAKHPGAAKSPACAAALALGEIQVAAAAPELVDLLKSPNMDIRAAAADALGSLGGSHEEALSAALADSCPPVRAAACRGLGGLAAKAAPTGEIVGKVVARLSDTSPLVRAAALDAMACMGEDVAPHTDRIKEHFADPSPLVRASSFKAMAAAGAKGSCYAPDVCRCIYDPAPSVRDAAMATLAEMGERGASFADEVATMIHAEEESDKLAALRALAKMGDSAKPLLTQIEVAKDDWSEEVRQAAEAAISALTMAAIAE